MTTSFSSLPIIDLSSFSCSNPSEEQPSALSKELYHVFATTGFAYLINAPLSFSHEEVFSMAKDFFEISEGAKMELAKKTFRKENSNTYRGYFPAQAGSDNLKEGFEMGRPTPLPQLSTNIPTKFNLTEANVWPSMESSFRSRPSSEKLYAELQTLSETLLSLLAISLNKPRDYFSSYLQNSLSTLRFLHYPPINPTSPQQELCCTPHTDSGILTLLHQDCTGGLEVLNAAGQWIPAPYVPGSIVVNIGDLMAKVSGGRFVATYHRVKSSPGKGRYSVPFFFEPGAGCVVNSVDDAGDEKGVVYGEHVSEKMKGWVEFQDVEKNEGITEEVLEISAEAV